MSAKADRDLIARIARGDRSAFAALYTRHETGLYRFITARLRNPVEASDVLHDTFLDVWRGAAAFRGASTVKTWMFGIAYHKVIARFRKGRREELTDAPPDQIDETDGFCLLGRAEEAGHIRFCLDTIKTAQRLVIELVFFEDMTCREAAEIASVPEGTVKTRLFHAKALLRRCLERRLGQPAAVGA